MWVLVEASMCGSDLIVVCVVGCLFVCGGWSGMCWVMQCVHGVCVVWFVLVWIGLVVFR